MKKFLIQTIALLIVVFAGLIYTFRSSEYPTLTQHITGNSSTADDTNLTIQTYQLGGQVLKVEVAATPEQRAQGLGNRASLAADAGMLFVFDNPGQPQFWMKGMQFPLDFIWLYQGQIVDISQNIPAPQSGQTDASLPIIQPQVAADSVLEVNAGFVSQHSIRIGDTLIKIE